MLKPLIVAPALLALCVACAGGAPPVAPPAPPLHDAVEVVADGFKFTEGPAVGPDAAVYFTDIPRKRIMRFDPGTGETTTFRQDSGLANGLFFREGDLYVCEGGRQRIAVYRAQRNADGKVTGHADASEPLVDETQGVPFNKPNDLAVDTTGGVYFTDPDYGNREGPKPAFEGVYHRAADGTLTCLADDFVRPNGVALHPDGSRLYVHDNGTSRIDVWDVTAPGQVENRRLFADLSDLGHEGNAGLDGLCVDDAGRVYSALFTAQSVVVHDAAGNRLQVVPTGPQTTNCVIGPEGDSLYVTADRALKRIKLTSQATH